MAGELLIFDAAGSTVDGGDPGTALNVGPGTDYSIRAASFPAPPQTIQFAGSVDTEGSLPSSRKHENRLISLTILCLTAAALRGLQGKIGKFAREGGTLKWVTPTAEVVYFDIHSADTFEPTIDKMLYVRSGAFCEVSMTLLGRPYGRGPEVDLGDNTETTLPCLVFTDTGIAGDMPGLGRLVIDEDQAQAQRTVVWGVQSRYYSSASTAGLFFQAESATSLAAAVATGPAGSSGAGTNNTQFQNSLTTDWASGTAEQFSIASTHIGSFRVFARVQIPNTNTGTPSVRAIWRNSSDPPTSNDPVSFSLGYKALWMLLDLGLVSFRVPYHGGNASNLITVAAISTDAGDDIYMDYVMLVPVDEGTGIGQTTSNSTWFPLAASGHLQLSHIGAFSTTSAVSSTTSWSRLPVYEGNYLLIPTAGAEARTVRVIVKASRGRPIRSAMAVDTQNADSGIDDISARLFYTPRYLVVPGT